MAVTVAQLGARVLRKLRITAIAQSGTPALSGSTVTVASIAAIALRKLRIVAFGQASTPALSGATVSVTELAERALRRLRVVAFGEAATPAPSGAVVTVANIAARALRKLNATALPQSDTIAVSGTLVSKRDIAIRALRLLSVVDAVEIPEAEDQEFAEEKVSEVQQLLASKNQISWAITAIPEAAAELYANMAAYLMAPAYGQAFDAARYQQANDQVVFITELGARGQTLCEQKVSALHQRLIQANKVSWADSAIPEYAAENYVEMVAHMVASEFRQKYPIEYAESEARLFELVIRGPAAQSLAEQKITTLHQELIAANRVSWASSAIPDYASDCYTDMVANALAAEFLISYTANDPAVKLFELVIRGAAGQALAEQKVSTIHQQLLQANRVSWASSAIPEYAAEIYADMAAAMVATAFAQPPAIAFAESEAALYELVTRGQAAQSLAEEKVRQVHSELGAAGKLRWTIFDIPDFAEEPYVFMAAFYLGPEFDKPVSADWYKWGRDTMVRGIALQSEDGPASADYY